MTILRTGVSLRRSRRRRRHQRRRSRPRRCAKAGTAKVHCYGINTCKGTSDCKTAKNECKGQNDCKGMGFKELTAKQCRKAAGGSLTAPN